MKKITAFLFLSFIKSVFLNSKIVTKGEEHNFSNFQSDIEYDYFTDSQSKRNVTITLTMKYVDNTPFNSFSIYEKYYKSGSFQINYQNANPQITLQNNELILIYSFISKFEELKYVGIIFKLKYNCDYIKMRFDIEDASSEDIDNPSCQDIENLSFELEYGLSNNFTNLLPCNYYFYIKCKQSQTVDISFTMNSYVNNQWTFYEVKEKFGQFISNQTDYPKIITDNNKAILSYSYKCIQLETNYIKLAMPLSSNAKYIVGLINSKESYYFDNNVPKTII